MSNTNTEQGVALMGCNTTGMQHAAPWWLHCICECYRRWRRQTTTNASGC